MEAEQEESGWFPFLVYAPVTLAAFAIPPPCSLQGESILTVMDVEGRGASPSKRKHGPKSPTRGSTRGEGETWNTAPSSRRETAVRLWERARRIRNGLEGDARARQGASHQPLSSSSSSSAAALRRGERGEYGTGRAHPDGVVIRLSDVFQMVALRRAPRRWGKEVLPSSGWAWVERPTAVEADGSRKNTR